MNDTISTTVMNLDTSPNTVMNLDTSPNTAMNLDTIPASNSNIALLEGIFSSKVHLIEGCRRILILPLG